MKKILIIFLFLSFTLLFGGTHSKELKRDCSYCDEIQTYNAAQQGDMIAQCRLKCICIDWVDLTQSYKDKVQPMTKALGENDLFAYMHKAARKKDNLFAQELLAYMYWEGVFGIPKNPSLAAYWYREAADNGSIGSQYLLGLLYFYGKGVSLNYKESENWLMIASNNGNNHAQYFLGLMYYTGRGVKKDYIRAYVWLRVASVFGNKQTVKLEKTLKNKLSKDEITEAHNISKLLIEHYKSHKNRLNKLVKKIN
jgi:TPR repeat protein